MELTRAPLRCALLAATAAAALPSFACAQDIAARPAAGVEVFASSDSDDSTVIRTALDLDLKNRSDDYRIGVRLEKAWYDPSNTGTRGREQVVARYADASGAWNWSVLAGTDGHSVIGSASVHDNSAFRKEAFIGRDVIETPMGLDRGIYSTFVGAAIELPADDRNVVTLLVRVQEFTGKNVRLHARANFVHVLKPDWGLSVQLRRRYFDDSDPGEFDYYAPGWYAQVLPVVQVRRFVSGWELVAAGGIGTQLDKLTNWRQSNFANLRFHSPRNDANWSVFGDLTYTDTPSNTASVGSGYDYLQVRLGVMRHF